MDFFSFPGLTGVHPCYPAPPKLFAILRLSDEGVSWSFLKGISKAGFVHTRRVLISTRVPLDATDHAPSNKKPHPLSSRARVCSPLSLGLTKRLPHVTALSWHLSPRGADFLGIPSRGGWGMRERLRPGLPRESFYCGSCPAAPGGGLGPRVGGGRGSFLDKLPATWSPAAGNCVRGKTPAG